jgi:hypothetical protein
MSMGRMYTAQFSAVAITALQDLFEILAPATGPIVVHSWEIFQITDVGDAAEEILRIETVRGVGAVTSGTGGSTVTCHPVCDGDAATTATVEANNTTRMVVGSGTLEVLSQHGWNVRMPYEKIYIPEERPVVSPGNRWTIALPVGPSDSLTTSGTVTFQQIG